MDEAGEAVGLKWVSLSNAPESDQERSKVSRDSFGAASWGFTEPRMEHELILATGRGYVLRARDQDRRHYFAYVPGDLRSGIHKVELRSNAPGFGALTVELLPSGAGDTLGLKLGNLTREGESADATVTVSGPLDRSQRLEVKGLWPGEYTATLGLHGDPWWALEETQISFDVTAGSTETLEVGVRAGGRIEFTVMAAGGLGDDEKHAQAEVRLRRTGETDWSWASLTSKRPGGAIVRGACAYLEGTVARSTVIRPGAYEVELSSEGFQTVLRGVMVTEGAAAEVEAVMVRL